MKNSNHEEPKATPPSGATDALTRALEAAALPLITHPAFLGRLRGTLSEAYASLAVIQRESTTAVEAAIDHLAHSDVNLDPDSKADLIEKYGAMLGKLKQLQNLLPRGEEEALRSLDGSTALRRKLGLEEMKGRPSSDDR